MVHIPSEREYLEKRIEEIDVQLNAIDPRLPVFERADLRIRLNREYIFVLNRLVALPQKIAQPISAD